MYSMTGFGKGVAAREGREVIIELKSVNHRFLDVVMRLPRSLNYLEDVIRTGIQQGLSRGHVEVWITYNNTREDARCVQADMEVLSAYMKAFDQIKERFDVRDDLSLSMVAKLPEVLTVKESEDDEQAMKSLTAEAVQAAVLAMKQMRAQEGENLKKDIILHCGIMRELLDRVEESAVTVIDDYRAKLRKRISELTDGVFDENRFTQEIAYMADKSAIDEETVRLGAHISHALELLEQDEPIGRKLDFLVQEMNREANTIGSKAQDMNILNHVVQIKSEIEKLREQIQNIE